jgi:hypothetical protein
VAKANLLRITMIADEILILRCEVEIKYLSHQRETSSFSLRRKLQIQYVKSKLSRFAFIISKELPFTNLFLENSQRRGLYSGVEPLERALSQNQDHSSAMHADFA